MKEIALNLALWTSVIFVGCSSTSNNYVLKNDLAAVVDSFTAANRGKAVYEMFIDKIRQDSFEIHLYAGDVTLTYEENDKYDQWPEISVVSNGERVYVYSGLERYIINNNSSREPHLKGKHRTMSAYWILTGKNSSVSCKRLSQRKLSIFASASEGDYSFYSTRY